MENLAEYRPQAARCRMADAEPGESKEPEGLFAPRRLPPTRSRARPRSGGAIGVIPKFGNDALDVLVGSVAPALAIGHRDRSRPGPGVW